MKTKLPLISVASLLAFMNTKNRNVRTDIGHIVPLLAKLKSYSEIIARAERELSRPDTLMDRDARLVWQAIDKLAYARQLQARYAKTGKPAVPEKPLISVQDVLKHMGTALQNPTPDASVLAEITNIVPLLAKEKNLQAISARGQAELRRMESWADRATRIAWAAIIRVAEYRLSLAPCSTKQSAKANQELLTIVNMVMTQHGNGMRALDFIKECAGALYYYKARYLFSLLQDFNPETYGFKVLTYAAPVGPENQFYYRDNR